MKRQNKNNLFTGVISDLLIIGSILTASVGCQNPLQRESDPMKEYPNLKTDVIPQEYVADQQKFDGLLFQLDVAGQGDNRTLHFYEGRESSYTIQARVFIDGLKFKLVATGFPENIQPQPTQDPSVWTIKWRPPVGTIPKGSSFLLNKDAKIEFALAEGSTRKAQDDFNLDKRNKSKSFYIYTNFSDVQPRIKVSGFQNGKTLNFGEFVPLVIEVIDPNSSKERKPELVASYDFANQTAESKTFPANNAVIFDDKRPDEFKGNGTWVFYRILDTTMIPAKYRNAGQNFDSGEFTLYAFNSSTMQRATSMLHFKLASPAGSQTTDAGTKSGKK